MRALDRTGELLAKKRMRWRRRFSDDDEGVCVAVDSVVGVPNEDNGSSLIDVNPDVVISHLLVWLLSVKDDGDSISFLIFILLSIGSCLMFSEKKHIHKIPIQKFP